MYFVEGVSTGAAFVVFVVEFISVSVVTIVGDVNIALVFASVVFVVSLGSKILLVKEKRCFSIVEISSSEN